MQQLVECIPNISEGRDTAKVSRIVARVQASGVDVLHVDSNADANRTVLTFAGTLNRVLSGVRELFSSCAQELDLREQVGAHPRIGAIDVCPFVALQHVSRDLLKQAVATLAEEMAEAYELPVFLYEHSAKSKQRQTLPGIRRGGFEALVDRIEEESWFPDFGPPRVHPSLGASVMGVRDVLLAYNVNLSGGDIIQAKRIAARVRKASPWVRAIAWEMPQYARLQVSLNLLRFWEFGLHDAYQLCASEAAVEGLALDGSELIGLVPQQALLAAGESFCPEEAEEDLRLETAIERLGLRSVRDFDPKLQVLESTLGLSSALTFPQSL